MPSTTKRVLAAALKERLKHQRLDEITVQSLADDAGVGRKTFYYHFQDIYDVLGWICEQQLGAPLREDPEMDFEEWCLRLIGLMEEDRAFYRRVFLAGNPELVREFCEGLVRPRMARQLFLTEDARTLPQQQSFVVDFCTKALTNYFIELCSSRKELDWAEVRCCLHGLLGVLRPSEELCLQVQAG